MKAHSRRDKAQRKANIPPKYFLPLVAIIAARAAASLFPESGLWGLNFSGFLPSWVVIALTAAGLVYALPAVSAPSYKALEAIGAFLFPESRGRRLLTHAAFAFASGALFVLAFIPMQFLGDGTHVVRTLYRFMHGAGYSEGTLMHEPLTVMLYSGFVSLVEVGSDAAGGLDLSRYSEVFMAVSNAAGAVYVFMILWFSHRLFREPAQRLALTASVLGSAGVLLFFGYIEYYLFVYFTGALYLMLSWLQIESRRFPAFPLALWLLSIAFHLSALVFLPSFAFLLSRWSAFRRNAEPPGTRKTLLMLAGFLAAGILLLLTLEVLGRNDFFLPLKTGEWKLTLLSSQHLLDVLNNLLLHAPFAVAAAAALFIGRRHVQASAPALLLAVASVSWTALCAAHIAIARDWDIYALVGVSGMMAAVAFIVRVKSSPVRTYLLSQAVVQPLLFVAPWIAVNVSFNPALARYQAITETYMDLLPAHYNAAHLENLRVAWAAVREREKEAETILRMSELTGEPYEYYKLLRALAAIEGPSPEAARLAGVALRRILELPDSVRNGPVGRDAESAKETLNEVYFSIVKAIGKHLRGENRVTWARSNCEAFMARTGAVLIPAMHMGETLYIEEKYAEAVPWLRRALRDSVAAPPDSGRTLSKICLALGVSMFHVGDKHGSLAYLRKAVMYPAAEAAVWSDLGVASYHSGLHAEARSAFEMAVEMGASLPNPFYYLGLLYADQPGGRLSAAEMFRRFLEVEPAGERAEMAKKRLAEVGQPGDRR